MTEVEQQRTERARVLEVVYEMTGGQVLKLVSVDDVAAGSGIERQTARLHMHFLHEQGLIRVRNLYVNITVRGATHYESSKIKPRTTESLPNVIHVQTMIGSQIQQNTSGSVQFQASPINVGAVRALVDEVERTLPELAASSEQLHDIRAELDTIQAQLRSSKPKPSVISEALRSLRSLIEGVAGNVIAAKLIPMFGPALGLPL